MELFHNKNTFFVKLLIRFFTITMIVILILGFSVIYYFKGFYFSQKEQEIIKNSSAVMEYLAQSFIENDKQEIVNWLNIIAKLNVGQVWLVNDQGYLIFSYPLFSEEKRFSKYEGIFKGRIISRQIDAGDFTDPMLLVGLPVNYDDQVIAALLIFTPIKEINSTIYQVEKLMFLISLFSVFLILVISYFWSKSLAKPLQNIGNIAYQISKGKYGKTVSIEKGGVSREIETLVASINSMSTKLELTINNLIKERNKLKHVLTGMEEGIIAVNDIGEIILINKSACELFDLEKSLTEKKQIDQIINDERVLAVFKTALKKDEENWQEVLIKRGYTRQCILIHCTPIYTKDNLFWGRVALFHDISERYRFEKLQREFVANISHELKAPLTSIQGAVEILLDGVINDKAKQRAYLNMILEESNRLTHLINEALILAEIDAGSLELHKEMINVRNLFENLQMFFNNIKKEQQQLKLKMTDEGVFIYANQEKIKQVLINLLSNSIKFSPADGMIELGVEICPTEIKVWVKDQGIGIPAVELNNIWERFYKVDKARTPGTNSSGLGLAIVKQIIEEHQGRVFVESELGRGSIFGFFLPVK